MADIAGFSRLMGKDEEGTTSRVLVFHEQVRATVESHGGRVVATAGDSVFGDFDSVVEALDCAARIQQDLHAANEGLAADERIDARIGLHLGDVIVEEYNVFGDGVNIAARLEQLAAPGGIMLSEAVYQQVKGRSDLPITEFGTRNLKNIEGPVRMFQIGPEAFGETPVPESQEFPDSPDSPKSTPVPDPETAKSAFAKAVRELATDAIAAKMESGDIEVDETGEGFSISMGARTRGIGALFAPATLVVIALGVLGILAKTSGWSMNGLYPFVGCAFVGLGLGMAVEGASGRKGMRSLLQAVGIGVGVAFVGGIVLKVVLWVIAASMLGSSLQTLTRGKTKTDEDGDLSRPRR